MGALLVLAVGVGVAVATWLLTAHLFIPGLDEGIYLMGGIRVHAGQVPYRDFFAFTGPFVYWAQALWAGPDIAMARVPVAVCAGAIASGAAAIGWRFGGWAAALVGALLWWGTTFGMYVRFVANHRWWSAGWFSVAAVFLFLPSERRPWHLAGAGVAMGLAVCSTPSFIAPLLLMLVYWGITDWRGAMWLAIGAAVPGIGTLAWLSANGALDAFIAGLRWIGSNYSGANQLPYGHVLTRGWNWNLIPALTGPVLGVAVPLAALWLRKREWLLPVLFAVGMLATAYPRMDVLQLLFVTAPFFAIGAAMVLRRVPALGLPILIPGAAAVLSFLLYQDRLVWTQTRVGRQQMVEPAVVPYEKLERLVPAGTSIFVFPYLSSLYYLLQARNPTRYEYLQPGMMGMEDETRVLDDLDRSPPEMVLWQDLPPSTVLLVWPKSDPARMRFERIERWIRANYQQVDDVESQYFRVTIWKKLQAQP